MDVHTAGTGSTRHYADSGRWRSAFRADVDHDSEVMPISVPNWSRSVFTVVVRNGDRHGIGTAAQGGRGDLAPLGSGES